MVRTGSSKLVANANSSRILWCHVNIFLDALLPGSGVPIQENASMDGSLLHAFRALFRLHGREDRAMAKEVVADGPGTRFVG